MPPHRTSMPAFPRHDPLMDKDNAPAPRVSATALAAKLSGVGASCVTAMKPALGRDTGPAVLRLGRPAQVPTLAFDDAKVGASITVPLRVQNDTPHTQSAHFENVPRGDGVLVDPDRVTLPPGASHVVRVSWCPSKVCTTRYTHIMKVTIDDGEGDVGRVKRGSKNALEVHMKGSRVSQAAGKTDKSKAAPGALSYTFNAKSNATRRASSVVSTSGLRCSETRRVSAIAPVAKTLRLRRVEEAECVASVNQTSQHHPSRFASFRTGASVATHHAEVFKGWINSVIAPAIDFGDSVGSGDVSSASAARARDRRGAESAARERLWHLYSNDTELREVILRVEALIDDGRLKLRGAGDNCENDKSGINAKSAGSFMDDISLRQKFRDALGSYSPFWLRTVVDVIVGDDLRTALGHDARDDTHKNTSEQKTRQTLIDALMRDAEIESTYGSAGSGGPPFREGYAEELPGTVLKRTLLLAFLLDRVQAGVSANAPLLFRKSSSVKTSADFVRLALSASCHGEGDLLRRLGHFGYKLHYAQDPVREFDFAVINLAVDLRDGIRLCHLVDVLGGVCGETSALTDASFPATARVAKKRNVERALSLAVSLGVVGLRSVCPDEIVDGSLEKTSLVLYHLQMHFQAPLLLGEWVTVTTETEVWRERRVAQITRGDVCKTFWKNTMASGAGTGATREDVDEELVAEALFNEELADARLSSSYEEAGDDSETVSVVQQCETKLLRWSRAVVSTFGAEVTNLSSDFASGAVLCLLIHAYAPELVHLREITRVDATSLGCLSIDAHAAGCVKRNFDVAKRACLVMPRGDELAKVPFDEIDATTCADGVSKHVVVSFLVVLRHRLLGLKQQHAAARVVQQTWLKRRRVRFEVEEHEPSVWAFRVQVAATRVLQKFCRGFLGRRVARERAAGIVTCQTLRRGFVARRLLRTAIDAATTIAKHARGMSARFEWIDIRFATLVAQTHCRGAFFRRKFLWLKDVTTKLQQLRRASVTRNAFLEYRTQSRAATKIASNFKTWCCRWDFLSLRDAAVVCQRRVRASQKTKTQRSAFLSLRRAAVSAQTVRRGAVCRRWFCEQKDAALTITRHWRGFTQRENFLDLKCYTLTCQASRRGAVQRRAFTTLRDAAVVSQRAARRAMAKRRADAEKNKCQEASNNLRHTAAITVQRHVRGWRAREEYLDFLCDVISCQALWRGALARKRFSCLVDEAVKRAAEVSARNLLELTARESAAHELAAARLADHTERQTAIEKAKSLKAETKRRVDAKTPGKSVRTRNSEIAPERNPSKAVAVKAERKLTFDLLQTTAEMETQAATVVQTAWRGWTCRVDFALVRWATVTAQAAVRGANARRAFVTLRHAAVACQRIARDTAQARKATFRAEAATLRRRRAAMGASAAAPARLLAAAPARVAAAPARVAAAPARLARNAFQATARRARTSSNSALAWSTASSVGASSEDEAEEAYAGFEDAATLSDQDDGNSSQDLSRFDQGHFESDEYEPRENKGFAAATAAAATLADARSLGDVRHALGALALAVQASAGGRAGASSQHALRSLLRTMRRCDRGEKHAPVLALAYEVLRTLSFDETGPGASCLFAQKDTLVTLTEHMQIFRDRPEVVGAAAVVLGNLCRDTQRARAVARAERGRTARRIKGIAEILTNTLAARKSRGAGYGQSLGEDRKAREEHTYVVALTHTVHAMTDLVTQLARCEGEVVYERVTARVSFSRPNEEGVEPFVAPSVPIAAAAPATKFKSAPPRSSSRLGNAQLAASKVVQVREVKEKPGHGRAPHNKQTNCPYTDERRAPLAPRYAPTAFAKKPVTNADAGRPGKGAPPPSVRREKENDTDTEQRTPPPPFSFASHFTTRWDTHNASPIMSPRYVR